MDPDPGIQVVTGGAGFVGTNLADGLLRAGYKVRILDNLSRDGVEQNLAFLRQKHRNRLEFLEADVRDPAAVSAALQGARQVFHLAGQVAVTHSLDDPQHDLAVNGVGTLNVLEAARAMREPPGVLFASTNKVYGDLGRVALRQTNQRHEPADADLAASGVSEAMPLDFHSPYGCSKGVADQYVLDYARSYGIPTVVFRMSCIYGPHQHGTEDQGWVAHFVLQALRKRPITVYGDGKQVRDVLFVEDLVDAMLRARDRIAELSGTAFNIGGGPANSTSLLELIDRIEALEERPLDVRFEPWRTGDQRWYVSDPHAFRERTGWRPRVAVDEGVTRLHAWLAEHRMPQRVHAAGEAPARTAS